MAELLDQALSPETMNRAWKLLHSDKAVWASGVRRQEMERDWPLHLMQLVDEVRSGRYRPAGLRRFTITKANGKQRVISTLTLRDKLVQRALLIVLEPLAEALYHPDSYGYRPRRSVAMACAKARERLNCGLLWLVDADIQSFFDEIPHDRLRKCLRAAIPDREVRHLIDLWLDIGYAQNSLFGTRRGIPQGAVLSPMLCNLYLHQLDMAWNAKNIPFVRFADDFLLFAPDQRRAEQALDYTRRKLAELDLALNPDKTRVTRAGRHVVFLGQRLPASRAQ